MSRKIGVFGGTFDPPHIGHLSAALNAKHALSLDLVLFVVANQPWQKVGSREITPAATRVAMVEAAVADLDGCEASTIELDRGGDSYTFDTLTELLNNDPAAELFLIVGTDVAESLDTWHRPDDVARMATLVVIDRPGTTGGTPPPGWRMERVEAPLVDLSSTELRRRLASGEPTRFLVPDSVHSVWTRWHSEQAAASAANQEG